MTSLDVVAARETTPVGPAWRVVHQVILPQDRDIDTLPLYVDAGAAERSEEDVPVTPVHSPLEAQLHPDDIVNTRSMIVQPGRRLSFGTYFNGFPAGYWRRWSIADRVRLRVRVSDAATVIVYRSNARGVAQRIESRTVEGPSTDLAFDLPLKPFGDGGWYWFDVVAGRDGARVEEADWSVAERGRPTGTVSIAITTFNRPDYCGDLLTAFSTSTQLLERVDEVVVVDQGTDRLRERSDFADIEASLGGRLRVLEQANLGGSGGFARGMWEGAIRQQRSTYVLLLDDDVKVEPEGVLRALHFADYARRPTLVGGHMFDMYARSILHTLGEGIERYRFFYAASRSLPSQHDFSTRNLRSTPWLHRRVDVDYNAWWMCLIPTSVIREIGLSLPVFIKWDDAEFGLRAGEHGYPTVSLPGAAVWHVSFGEKDDTVDWQAYYHQRNRMLAALLYSPYERGGGLLRHSLQIDVKHLVSMQYYALHLRHLALEDILRGPDHLHEQLPTTLPRLRALSKKFMDARMANDVDAFPEPKQRKPPRRGREPSKPNRLTLVPLALRAVARQFSVPVQASSLERPQAALAHQEGKWWRLAQYDSALVSNADGTAVSWYRRDPAQMRKLLARSTELHRRLLTEWPRLREAYQAALSEFTAPKAWEQHFTDPDDDRT